MQPLVLTLGEPAGIGPDLTLAIWLRRAELGIAPFYIVADPDFLRRRARKLGLDIPIVTVAPASAAASFRAALPVVPLDLTVSAEAGHPDRSSAPAAVASIRRATADVMSGAASAVVTNPIAKNVLYDWGFAEPGHTEFLAKLVQEATGKVLRPVMMLWSPELAVVPVTIHLPLKDIFKQLSAELIVETGRIVARDLSRRFGLRHPRLVVTGLNPHAGEAGNLGEEDGMIVAPAVARLAADGIDVRGPLPAELSVPRAGAGDLRCGSVHVSRSGADPDQDARLRSRGQCHARATLRAHLARPRYGLRHCRHRQRRSDEPDRGAAPGETARRGGRDAGEPRAPAGVVTSS